FYYLVPRLFGTRLWSDKLADLHFWIGTFGILLYVAAMWVAGITQGLMWRAETPDGGLLYSNWVEIVKQMMPLYLLRSIGGALFITGWVLMIYNLFKTVRQGAATDGAAEVVPLPKVVPVGMPSNARLVFGAPLLLGALGLGGAIAMGGFNLNLAVVGIVVLIAVTITSAFLLARAAEGGRYRWHDLIEQRPLAFSVLVVVAVAAGGLVELVPGIWVRKEVPRAVDGSVAVRPYTALELEGRDVYVSEGCYVCHSQMIRPFRSEVLRYGGDPSRIEESMWDHPFQWGSKRTGPDLAREGVTRPDVVWHWQHMLDPRATSPGSNMPAYPWLATDKVAWQATANKLRAMQRLGVPYTDEDIASAETSYFAQADAIVQKLAESRLVAERDSKLVALIAYLLRLGKNQVPAGTASRQ